MERDRYKEVEAVKVVVHPRPARKEYVNGDGEIVLASDMSLVDQMYINGWSDDPGEGKAVLLPDGREVLNPLPMAPPIGFVAQPSLMEMMDQMLRVKLKLLADADVVDSPEDAEDFDIPDELGEPPTLYEVEMAEEYPEFRPDPPPAADPPDPPPSADPPVS